jgi:HK97 family phage prohead protease
MPEIEYKRLPFAVKEIVDVSSGGWELAGYASTFGDPPDFYGDVIMPGAFAASIASYAPKFLFEHAEPIGNTLEIREDDHGLYGRWSIVDTRSGTDAYKLAKAGVLDSLSIGFFAEEYAYRDDGARVLLRIDLPEVSAVAIPANRRAVVTDVKQQAGVRPFADHSEYVRVAVRSWVDRVRSGSELRGSEGKSPLTDERRVAVAEMSGSLRSVADELDALIRTATPRPAPRHDFDALRARLARLGVLSTEGDPT